MPRVIEKIVLSIVFVVLVGFNSLFIFGQQGTATVKDTDGTRENVNVVAQQKGITTNKKSGDILQVEGEEKENEESDEVPLDTLQLGNGMLTEEQAKAIAQGLIQGAVVDFEAEREDGKLVYAMAIAAQGDVTEVEIDAVTGEVLEIEWGGH